MNFSSVLLHDAVADAEAKAGAFANRLGGVERVKDTMGFADALAGIGKEDDNVAAVALRFYRENAAAGFRHGVQSVADDVEKDLHQLIVVAANSGEHRLQLQLDARPATMQIERAQLNRVADHSVDIEKSFFRGHLSRETQQVLHQVAGTPRLLSYFHSSSASAFRKRGIVGQQVGIAQNSRQGIVNFVSGASSQLP